LGLLALAARKVGSLNDVDFVLEHIEKALSNIPNAVSLLDEPRDIVLYGFGRIGRIMARLLIERTTSANPLRLRAIVVRGGRDGDLRKRASLLRRDSANQPEDINYNDHGIDNALIIDNTGVFKDEAALSRHLVPGASRVLLTSPAGGKIKNIVYGVNHSDIKDDDKIVCAASCTTNAITPVLKVINDQYGIQTGHVETVHSYTNDQNLIDNYHTAELNMVLTSTGAAKAVSKALPELEGKLTGNAIRVPTPNVSMAVCNLNLDKATTRDELNAHMREVAFNGDLKQQIDYSFSNPKPISGCGVQSAVLLHIGVFPGIA